MWFDISIRKFIDYKEDFDTSLGDISGWTFLMKVRGHPRSEGVVATYTDELVGNEDGILTLTLTDTQTTELNPGYYVYDIIGENESEIKHVVAEGVLVVSNIISR